MKKKSARLLAIIMILVVAILSVTGCGRSGSRFENQLPEISITSFEGWTPDNVPANIDTTTYEYVFQQKIYWHGTDADGVISGYAFRVLDENHNPISTPGYKYLASATDNLIPEEMLTNFGEGWVLHYLPSADQSLALDDPEADRTIWTDQKYAEINFPAANPDGAPMPTISSFEVVAIDNRGGISPVPAWRKFRTNSKRPVCIVNTTKGNPHGGNVGSGITLKFSMTYPDSLNLLIDPIPSKFEFKMMKVYDDTGEIVPDTETDWISTEDQPKIDEYRLTSKAEPKLVFDYTEEGISLGTSTRVIARAMDLASVYSEFPPSASADQLPGWEMRFKVKPGFRPRTLIYSDKILALGDNHFETRKDNSTEEDLPNTIVQNEQRFATPLFQDMQNHKTVVHSNNLKLYVRWGYWGEYGDEDSEGNVSYPLDNPYIKKVNSVISEPDPEVGYPGGENYYGEITHFDIRYDGAPYDFPPFAESIVEDIDESGNPRQWLRLPISSPLRQSIVLTGQQLSIGEHTFEVRCVDSQDEVSKYPAVLTFYVLPYVAPSSRSGVLIVDDDPDNSATSPGELVYAKYEAMTADIPNVTVVKYGGNGASDTFADARNRYLAYSDLQNYKLVIYHADDPGNGGTIEAEVDGLALYVRKGGNLLISHTSQFASKAVDFTNKRAYTLLDYMGYPIDMKNKMGTGPQNPATGSFLQDAIGQLGYNDIGVQYSEHPDNADSTQAFLPLVENLHGYAQVAYFLSPADGENGTASYTGEPIYTYGCKAVDYPVAPPSQAQFDFYNGKVIGLRKVNNNGSRVYTLTYPLSIMLESQAKEFINQIWNELM